MAVISTTLCYPSPARPAQGIFVQRRLEAIHRIMPVEVIAPVLWFPGDPRRWGRRSTGSNDPVRNTGSEEQFHDPVNSPPVFRPRMFYLPGVAKTLDAWFYARAFRRALRSLCSARRPDLIDAHFEWPDGVGAWYVARELGVPFVCTLRGKLVSRISEPGMFRRLREMLLGADGLVAVSRSLADLARTVAGRDLAIRVIPNGIDGEIFNGLPDAAEANRPSSTARRQLGWSVEGRYVVSVAHLQELKGWHRLIEAWPMVRRRMGDVRLILVGDRAGELNYERRLQAMLKGVNGAGLLSVQLIGRVQSKMVATLLNAADLFALTSCSEGWCNAIAEALACGCPVLATDVGGNREIIAGDETGFLVPVDEPSALIEGLCRALSRRWNRSQIARMGGRRNWQQVAVECVDVFKEVLERRERQR